METVRSPVLQATVSCFRAFFPAAAAKEAECSLGGQGDGGRWRGKGDGGGLLSPQVGVGSPQGGQPVQGVFSLYHLQHNTLDKISKSGAAMVTTA